MRGGTTLAGSAALAACQHEQETGVRAVVTRGSGQRNNEARRSLRLGVREAQTMQRLENEKGRQAPLKKEYTALSLFFGRGGGLGRSGGFIFHLVLAPHRRRVMGLLRSAPLVPRRRLARPPLLFFSFAGRGRRTRAGTTGDGAGGGSGVGGERGHGSWNIRELGGGGLGPSHGATEGRRRALRLAGELRKQARSEAL